MTEVLEIPTLARGLSIGAVADTRRDFVLTPEWITSTNAIVGKKRSGKSYLSGVIEEDLCKAGIQWVCLDPVSAHWGIREKYKIPVFGGPKADIPLRADMGAEIARGAVDEGWSLIIDLKGESKNVQRRLVTDFCEGLLTHNTHPMHVFLEECTEFIPQQVRPDQTVAFDAVDRLVRLGGGSGIGITLISQRPAKINKDVLTQIDTLFVFRMIGPQDRKAVRDWLEANVEEEKVEEVMASLVKLATGTCWVWSPEQLDFFGQVRVRERETFHAGATPKVGHKASARMVDIDVGALRKRFEARPAPAAVDGKGKADKVSADLLVQKEAAILEMRQKTTRLEGIAKEQGDAIALLKRHLEAAEREADAGRGLAKALRVLLGGVPATAGKGAGLDLEAVVEAVLARLPKGQSGILVSVAAPEALRKRFQEEEVTRLVGKIRGLDDQARRVLSLLESLDKALSLNGICNRLGVSAGGDSWRRVKESIQILEGLGFVESAKGSHGFRASVKNKIAADLADYQATEEEIEQTYLHVLAVLAEEGGGRG